MAAMNPMVSPLALERLMKKTSSRSPVGEVAQASMPSMILSMFGFAATLCRMNSSSTHPCLPPE